MWSQTPQFDVLLNTPNDVGITMNVHHGIIKSLELKYSRLSPKVQEQLRAALVEQKLQDISNWTAFLQHRLTHPDDRTAAIAKRLDELVPIPKPMDS
jgi:lipoate-protein ligase A